MSEYPPQPVDHRDLQEGVYDGAEFAASLQALEGRLGIVATEGQIEMKTKSDKGTLHPSGVSHGAEDIDSVLDAAYDINQTYNAILDEGDNVYDEAAKMNEEHEAKQTAELRQLIDEALTELHQAEDDARPEPTADKKAEIDNRKAAASKTDDSKTAEATATSLIMSADYTKAVLTQAGVAELLPGQASVDSATGEVIIANPLNKNSLTVVHPQIGGKPTVTTYNFDPSGELTIKTNGVTTEASIARETTGDISIGRQNKIVLPSPVAKVFGVEFVLAA